MQSVIYFTYTVDWNALSLDNLLTKGLEMTTLHADSTIFDNVLSALLGELASNGV